MYNMYLQYTMYITAFKICMICSYLRDPMHLNWNGIFQDSVFELARGLSLGPI